MRLFAQEHDLMKACPYCASISVVPSGSCLGDAAYCGMEDGPASTHTYL